MNKLIISVVAVLAVSLAHAQSTTATLESNSHGAQNLAVLHSQDNLFGFAQYCEGGWWQVYAGLSHTGNVSDVAYQAALGAGAESNGFRYGGWLWAGERNLSFIHLFEGGGSGPWHRSIAKYAVSDDLTLGVTDRAFYGRGVRAEYMIGRTSTLIGEVFEGGTSTLALSTAF